MQNFDHNIRWKDHLRVQVESLERPGAPEWRNADSQMGQKCSLGARKQTPLGLEETNSARESKTGFEGPKGSRAPLGATGGTPEGPGGTQESAKRAQDGSRGGLEGQKCEKQKRQKTSCFFIGLLGAPRWPQRGSYGTIWVPAR